MNVDPIMAAGIELTLGLKIAIDRHDAYVHDSRQSNAPVFFFQRQVIPTGLPLKFDSVCAYVLLAVVFELNVDVTRNPDG